jgi:hypothetical protein
MSSEGGGGNTASSRSGEKSTKSREQTEDTKQSSTDTDQRETTPSTTGSTAEIEGNDATEGGVDNLEKKPAARPSHQEGEEAVATSQVTPSQETIERPRQVIAVSANKGPTAFFNLAKRFLITDEICDLSALEGAIVSAIDAAHLLERSKLATIVRVQTSYVTVEPKRNKRVTPPAADIGAATDQQPYSARDPSSAVAYSQTHQPQEGRPPSRQRREGKRGERELKRARIVITVRRTAAYKQWLDDNPLQAVIAGDGDDEKRTTDTQAEPSDVESKSS